MKKRILTFVTMSLFLVAFIGCEKEEELVPQDDEQISVTEDESLSSSVKQSLSSRSVMFYYDESGIYAPGKTAMQGALNIFNSTFSTNFYVSTSRWWTHSNNFDHIWEAQEHLADNYPFSYVFAVGGATGRLDSIGGGGTQDGMHFAIEWDYFSNDTQRKACFLHEFTHNVPDCRSNHKDPLTGEEDNDFKYCVLSAAGVERGVLYYCPDCEERVQKEVDKLP